MRCSGTLWVRLNLSFHCSLLILRTAHHSPTYFEYINPDFQDVITRSSNSVQASGRISDIFGCAAEILSGHASMVVGDAQALSAATAQTDKLHTLSEEAQQSAFALTAPLDSSVDARTAKYDVEEMQTLAKAFNELIEVAIVASVFEQRADWQGITASSLRAASMTLASS